MESQPKEDTDVATSSAKSTVWSNINNSGGGGKKKMSTPSVFTLLPVTESAMESQPKEDEDVATSNSKTTVWGYISNSGKKKKKKKSSSGDGTLFPGMGSATPSEYTLFPGSQGTTPSEYSCNITTATTTKATSSPKNTVWSYITNSGKKKKKKSSSGGEDTLLPEIDSDTDTDTVELNKSFIADFQAEEETNHATIKAPRPPANKWKKKKTKTKFTAPSTPAADGTHRLTDVPSYLLSRVQFDVVSASNRKARPPGSVRVLLGAFLESMPEYFSWRNSRVQFSELSESMPKVDRTGVSSPLNYMQRVSSENPRHTCAECGFPLVAESEKLCEPCNHYHTYRRRFVPYNFDDSEQMNPPLAGAFIMMTLLFLIAVGCFLGVIRYGVGLHQKIAHQWVSAVFIAMLQHILILEPFKVLLVSYHMSFTERRLLS